MRKDVDKVFVPLQKQYFEEQKAIDEKCKNLNKKEMREFLTNRSIRLGTEVFEKAWETGDNLWNKYDEKF